MVDGILGAELLPPWRCALTLVEVGWDDVMSSEVAFYRATKGAMGELIAQADNAPAPRERSGPAGATIPASIPTAGPA